MDQDHLKTVYAHIDSERTPAVKVHTMSTNLISKWDIQFDSGLVNFHDRAVLSLLFLSHCKKFMIMLI